MDKQQEIVKKLCKNSRYLQIASDVYNVGFFYVEEAHEVFKPKYLKNMVNKGYLEYDNHLDRYLVTSVVSMYFEGYIKRNGEYTHKYYYG